ncbi:hypothetical protein BT96DRAFT_995557 [Gymnopus androsaceus JB14]|uniref:Uncharacterized protein n=1 Tax=Gymnopus androsaceus JB14 TaxID=1447944 RepID=A0A6A4HGJ8_9AGAR|nr:hypothetical protein BT96DRAFT_995557 [Gymnopus androsaceus JB14]
MDGFARENLRKSPAIAPETPIHLIVQPSNASQCQDPLRREEIAVEGAHGVEHGFWHPNLHSEELMPPPRKPGCRVTKNLALSIPTIPSTPSNASQYTSTAPRNPPSPLMPSAFLLSPVTPSISTISDMRTMGSHSRASDTFPSPHSATEFGHTSLPNSESLEPSAVGLEHQLWMSYANPTFSHSRPPVHPSKMSDSKRLEKAIEFIVDELKNMSRNLTWNS